MKISRRDFFKVSGSGAFAATFGQRNTEAKMFTDTLRIQGAVRSTTICPYCAVGCGLIVHSKQGKVIHVEGDPEHPINRGALCSKGAALTQIAHSATRVTRPMYRPPGSDSWKEVDWDWVLDEIAGRIKNARDATFTERNAKGQTVNRCNGMAHVGSAALDNEECYLLQKWLRSLGLVYIEHQARI